MDYEKAYKEALERAKHYIQAYKDQSNPLTECAAQTVFDIFPELKESEDERIRKALIALVEWAECFSASGITPEESEAMLSWLEKQKESTMDKLHRLSVPATENWLKIAEEYEREKLNRSPQSRVRRIKSL